MRRIPTLSNDASRSWLVQAMLDMDRLIEFGQSTVMNVDVDGF
ncbi:hypothetical protein [Burkholderia sp. WP9]|nr:hypothetical protein [Burkholderia sp. WP9]